MRCRTGMLEYGTHDASVACGVACRGPSMADQSFKEEADITTLVRRFGITGQMPNNLVPPVYQDFSGIFDFQTAQNALVAAKRSFMQLPAHVRKRFGHDPQEFVAFCSDKENLVEMRKMGLAVDPPVVEPEKVQKVEIVAGTAPVKPA